MGKNSGDINTTYFIRTTNAELAMQVFIFHLIGVKPGNAIPAEHEELVESCLDSFSTSKSASVSFENAAG